MPPEKTDLKYLWDMLDASNTIVTMTAGKSLLDYERDKPLRLAVERAVEIIGEAARRVSEAFKSAHPGIPWQAIIATRHIIAHEYGDLQNDKMWRIAVTHVPALVGHIAPILKANPPGSADSSATPPNS